MEINNDPTSIQASINCPQIIDRQTTQTTQVTTQLQIKTLDPNAVPVHLPLERPLNENMRGIGKFTTFTIEGVNRRGFIVLYDEKGLVPEDEQLYLVADDSEQYLIPDTNLSSNVTGPCTKYVNITTRIYDNNTRFCGNCDGYYYIEYRIDPTLQNNLVSNTHPLITIKNRRLIPLVSGQYGQIRKYKTCCETHYLIVGDAHKCKNGSIRVEPKNVDNILYYKHCKEIKYSYISLRYLGYCECTVHIDTVGCSRKHCC